MSLQLNKPYIQGNYAYDFYVFMCKGDVARFLFSFLLRSFSFFVFICPPERQLHWRLQREAAFSFPFSVNQTSTESSSPTNPNFIFRKCKKQLCLLSHITFTFHTRVHVIYSSLKSHFVVIRI